jgi:hypothetical protein
MHRTATRAAGVACITVAVSMLAAGPAPAKPAPPGPGNSPAAQACKKGGWQNLVTSTGQTFASEPECTSYAAGGGTLMPKPPPDPCAGGGYLDLYRQDGTPFATAADCASYSGSLVKLALTELYLINDLTSPIRDVAGVLAFGLKPGSSITTYTDYLGPTGPFTFQFTAFSAVAADGTADVSGGANECDVGPAELVDMQSTATTASGSVVTSRRVPQTLCPTP